MLRALAVSIALMAGGCPPSPAPPDSGTDAAPPPPSDAGPQPSDWCAAGEQNLTKLGCLDSRGKALAGPNFHGVMWSETCRYNGAHGVDMKPSCIAAAKSCAEVESCR